MEARLYAYLSYQDARAALEWLQNVGFIVVRRQDGPNNTVTHATVTHAEVRLGNAVVMLASDDAGYTTPPLMGRSTGRGLYLLVDDVDAFFDRATSAGGIPVIEPEDTEWGTRRCRILDPQGHEWSAGSYEPGAAW